MSLCLVQITLISSYIYQRHKSIYERQFYKGQKYDSIVCNIIVIIRNRKTLSLCCKIKDVCKFSSIVTCICVIFRRLLLQYLTDSQRQVQQVCVCEYISLFLSNFMGLVMEIQSEYLLRERERERERERGVKQSYN